MNRITTHIVILTIVLMAASLSPFLDNGKGSSLSADTTSGEKWINPFIDKIDQKYTVPDGYIGIRNEEDLLKIGSNESYGETGLEWSFSAKYIQMDNIDLGGKNLNGGVEVNMELNVDDDLLTVTLTNSSGDPIQNVEVWVEGVKEMTDINGSSSFSYDNTKSCAVMCGGYVETETFAIAHTIPADHTGDIDPLSFDSNGNMDPIGFNSDSGFTGIYDGNGYKVIGANIAVYDAGYEEYAKINVGFFSSLNYDDSVTGGSIRIENLGIEGGYTVLVTKDSGDSRTGGVVGYIGKNTNIYNCYNSNLIYSMTGTNYTGGIVGYDNSDISAQIAYCFNTGNIVIYANEYSHGTIYAGGIGGWSAGLLYGTYNEGNINLVNLYSRNNALGGIAGYKTYFGIYSSQNSGNIYSSMNGSISVGGIAGNVPLMVDCFNEGDIELESQKLDAFVNTISAGGLMGVGGYSRNSHNLGSMNVSYEPDADVEILIGGIVGMISNGTVNIVASYFLEKNMTLNSQLCPDLIVGGVYRDHKYNIDIDLDPEPSEIQATGPRGPDAFRDQSTFYIGKTATGNPPEVRGYVFMGDTDDPIWGMFSGVTSGLSFLVDLTSIDISASPSDVTVPISGTASFSVDAGSAWDLSYQWQTSDDEGSTWMDIPGAVADTYDVKPLTMDLDGNLYRCVVYNERGAIFSNAASLTLFGLLYTTISFDSNGGSGTMEDMTELSGSVQSMPASSFTREGWSQTGWNTSADGSGTSYPISGTFTMPSSDTTLYAMWQYGDVFVISAIVNGDNGKISPSGTVAVQKGSDMTFTMTPNSRCKVTDVKVDGVSVGAVDTYTFTDINNNHTISVSFERSVFSINLWFLYVAMAVTFISAVSLWYIHKNDDEESELDR